MRLLIILPRQPEATGNFVTARRLQTGLQNLGMTVELLPLHPDEHTTLTTAVNRFHPDRLLLLHAWRSGLPWLNSAEAKTIPTTVLLTGTDFNHEIDDPEKGPAIKLVLQGAAAIICQNRLTFDNLSEQKPLWSDRLHYIPAGVLLGQTPWSVRQRLSIPDKIRLFLHPAGIRPVKANLELLQLCDTLAERHPDFVLAFCGPALDLDYFKRFISAVEQRPWAHYLGVIPGDAMPNAMRDADLVLNHSISEGMSNALLEAVAVGRPVLARNIPGNAVIQPLSEQVTIYDSGQEFINKAQLFLTDPPRLKPLDTTNSNVFSAAIEAEKFATLLHSIVA